MNITKKDFEKTLDRRFLKALKSVYKPIRNRDIKKSVLANNATTLLKENNYSPSIPEFIIDYDKGHGVTRLVPVFTPLDYSVYYYCARNLESNIAINRVEGTFGGWSLGGKLRKLENEHAQISDIDYPMTNTLNPGAWAKYYGEFNSKIKEYIDELSEDYIVVEIDVANFYDNIRLDVLEQKIRLVSAKDKGAVIDLLFHFLRNSNKQVYSFKPQSVGIPQDMIGDCSRLLANFYLQDYDLSIKEYCDEHSIKYLRYADDQLFFTPKSMDYKQVVKKASIELNKIGLNINQKKAKKWSLGELARYRAFEIFDLLDADKKNDKQLPADCEKFAVATTAAIKDKNRELKNDGLSLINKILGVGLQKLTKQTQSKLLKLIYNGGYLQFIKSAYIKTLYQALNAKERETLLSELKNYAEKAIHSSFSYECAKFSKECALGVSRYFTSHVNRLNKEWL